MSYHISWLVEGYVIDVSFEGNLTVEELEDQAFAALEYMNNGETELIHSILDLTALEKVPLSMSIFSGSFAEPLRHPRVGWNIFITTNRMFKLMVSTILKLSSGKYRIFPTREEGLAFLNEVDNTLPNLLEIDRKNRA